MLTVSTTTGLHKVIEIAEYWHNKDILPGMVMEECAEVIQAINKLSRWRKADITLPPDDIKRIEEAANYRRKIADEIGDLLLILDAYMYIEGIDYREMEDHIAKKLEMEKEV